MALPRRIFIYWILLLVPALAMGSAAIYLLHREQARIAEKSAEAAEARRASVAARTRLIAENVELLLGDVEDGLLEALGAPTDQDLLPFLSDWEKSNPLVRTAYLATADGRLLRPQANATDEDGRGFVRRFNRLIAGGIPWAPVTAEKVALPEQNKLQLDENGPRKEVAANVAQVQSVRRDVQNLFKSYPEPASAAAGPSADSAAAAGTGLSTDRVATNRRYKLPATIEPERRVPASPNSASDVSAPGQTTQHAPTKAEASPAVAPAKDAAIARHGWTSTNIDGRQHVFGWLQPDGRGNVRGVELELAGLLSRLGGALPQEFGRGEGYALQDEQGRIVHQTGAVPGAATARGAESSFYEPAGPTVQLPLGSPLLPGWKVVAYLATNEEESGGGNLFWMGGLLVGVFVLAIVAGGSLLLWQARRSEDEAARKTSFVGNVSHEFKTPLTTIRLYSELLEQGRVRDEAQAGDYLRTIGRETQRLARLVNNALDFSRLEQGRKKYARESLDLVAELGRLLDTHEPRVAEAGLALRRTFFAARVDITTDRDALEQIVLNLIDNACKYAATGGEVLVAIRPGANGTTDIRVADRGPGVPVEHRERIFEKFHRVDDALTAEKSGAGLGLSIARQLARGLGGELRFQPRDGGGAEFILTLP